MSRVLGRECWWPDARCGANGVWMALSSQLSSNQIRFRTVSRSLCRSSSCVEFVFLTASRPGRQEFCSSTAEKEALGHRRSRLKVRWRGVSRMVGEFDRQRSFREEEKDKNRTEV